MILGQGNFALSNSGGSNYFANTSEWKSAEVISRILFSPQVVAAVGFFSSLEIKRIHQPNVIGTLFVLNIFLL